MTSKTRGSRMQAKSFRQVKLWVPDTRQPGFASQCRRQSRLAAKTDPLEGVLVQLDHVAAETEGWTQ